MDLPAQAALVIVDVQTAIDHPKYANRNNSDLLPNLRRLLEHWRRLGRPIYFIADDSPDVYVLADAASTLTEAAHQQALQDLAAASAKIISTSEACTPQP